MSMACGDRPALSTAPTETQEPLLSGPAPKIGLLLAGAALAGGLFGLGEATAVLVEGRLWIPSPEVLLVSAFVTGALLAVLPGALLGRRIGGRFGGLAGGVLSLWALAAALEVVTDPAPYQEAPWWIDSPLALAAILAAAVVGVELCRRHRLLGTMAVLATVLLPAGSALRSRPPAPPEAPDGLPNVLLVTLDTTRADHLGAYGHPTVQTPALDAMAAEGVLFETAVAQAAVTGPSHTTLLTGQGTWTHDSLLNGIPVAPEVETLPERLRSMGYDTGAFVSAYVLDGELGFARGFEVYDDDFSLPKGSSALLPWRLKEAGLRRLDPDYVLERRGGHTVDDALSWLESAEGPWLLWVHLFDPHGPYEPPPPYDTLYYSGDPRDPSHTSMDRVEGVAAYLEPSLAGITDVDWVLAQYQGEISYADEQVARLLAAAGPDALALVSGDHGESLGDNGVWFNHGDDLTVAATQVPLIMKWTGRIPSGVRVPDPTELTDVVPTLYELLGQPVPSGLDGRSLVPTWSGSRGRDHARGVCFDREANLAERDAAVSQGRPPPPPRWRMAALRGTDHLYVHRDSSGFGDQLYDLVDPEQERIAEETATPEGAERVELYRGLARELLTAGEAGVERSAIELSDEDRARLEALGYIE